MHPNSLKNLEKNKGQFKSDTELARKAKRNSDTRKRQKKLIAEGGFSPDENFNEIQAFQEDMKKRGLFGLWLKAQKMKGELAGHYVDRHEVREVEPPIIKDDIG